MVEFSYSQTAGTMIFEQYYLECLSQASYLIGDKSSGKSIVIDPRRDISPYLHTAELHGLSIEWILETHFHADFVSGHLELAKKLKLTSAYHQKPMLNLISQHLTMDI